MTKRPTQDNPPSSKGADSETDEVDKEDDEASGEDESSFDESWLFTENDAVEYEDNVVTSEKHKYVKTSLSAICLQLGEEIASATSGLKSSLAGKAQYKHTAKHFPSKVRPFY